VLPCGSLKLPTGAIVENKIILFSNYKKISNFLINLKIIKIIIIKNKNYKNLKKLKRWPALPKGWPATPLLASHPLGRSGVVRPPPKS
jgi:hypothetical protein